MATETQLPTVPLGRWCPGWDSLGVSPGLNSSEYGIEHLQCHCFSPRLSDGDHTCLIPVLSLESSSEACQPLFIICDNKPSWNRHKDKAERPLQTQNSDYWPNKHPHPRSRGMCVICWPESHSLWFQEAISAVYSALWVE